MKQDNLICEGKNRYGWIQNLQHTSSRTIGSPTCIRPVTFKKKTLQESFALHSTSVMMPPPTNNSTQTSLPTTPTVILFGKIGHGKTCILNKICRASFESHMSSQSCTRRLQRGKSRHYGMIVVDTPGFYATEDVEQHTFCQTQALTAVGELSGIYVVVKYARCSDMAETVNKIMDFVGHDAEDFIRVIITHVDTVDKREFDAEETKANLANLLDIPPHCIALTGHAKHDDTPADSKSIADSIEEFIHTTLHPLPRTFQVSNDQLGCISNLCVGARKFKQAIEEVNGKLKAATAACQTLMVPASSSSLPPDDLARRHLCRPVVFAVGATRQVTKSMVHDARDQLNIQGGRELTPEERKILSGKLGLLVSISLESFLNETALQCGSFYPKTNHGYPSLNITYRKATIAMDGDDNWEVVYHLNGEEIPVSNLAMRLKDHDLKQTTPRAKRKTSQDGNTLEKNKRKKPDSRPVVSSCDDSNIHNVSIDDPASDNIASCTQFRQHNSSCGIPGNDKVKDQDLPVPNRSYCSCLFLPFSFLLFAMIWARSTPGIQEFFGIHNQGGQMMSPSRKSEDLGPQAATSVCEITEVHV